MVPVDVDRVSLRIFLAVCEEGGFARAGRRLSLSEPAVSIRVRNLERRIGFLLFHRTPSGIQLTGSGEIFRDRVGVAMAQWQTAIEDALAAARHTTLRITLWCSAEMTSHLLPDLLPRCAAAQPEIELVVQSSRPGQVLSDLQNGQLDCALISDVSAPLLKGFESTPCMRRPVGLVLGPEHPLAQQECVTPLDLRGQRLIRFIGSYWPRIQSQLESSGVRLEETYVESMNARKTLVRQGQGILFVTITTVLKEIEAGELIFRPVEIEPGQYLQLDNWFCYSNAHVLRDELGDLQRLVLECTGRLRAQCEAILWRAGSPPPFSLGHTG